MSFGGHASKTDRIELTHAKDVGYDLATVLMVRGDDGDPIAPALVSLTTAEGVLSTRDDAPAADLCHIDQVRGAMQYVDGLKFNTPLVHVIDREADSVNHWRQWSADGHLALVRGDDRKVLCAGQETSLVAVADRLRQEDAFQDAGTARYHGRWRGCTSPRPRSSCTGRANGMWASKKIDIPGPPLPLRLVVTEVRDSKGRVLARWLLLTNVPVALADAATIARWYYFRWRIESLSQAPQGCRLAVGELAAARRPTAPDQAVAGAAGVCVDLGVGAA